MGYYRIPADFAFAAHWAGNSPDWIWPRDTTLIVAPMVQIVLLAAFFLIGRLLTKNHYAKVQHIFDPSLTLLMAVVASTQLGLLLTGIGSDLDFVRFTGLWFGVALLVLGIVLFEAERHTYAGLRMPWPIRSERGWRIVHRLTGLAFGLAGVALGVLVWLDVGNGLLVTAFCAAVFVPVAIAGLSTLFSRARSA
ncbi:SdpI family protein [Devosia sp. 2618]|uniref:SdpI family protein n=1 Tax=Devosia sp. 2618 TaxID=3156454 RepID=UPI003395807B